MNEKNALKVGKEMAAKPRRMRKAVCPKCGIRPPATARGRCVECEREEKRIWYQNNKQIEHERQEAKQRERTKRFEQLVEWCRAVGIRELAGRVK